MKNKDLFVVGIGASAGGLDAIQQLFDNISPNTGMAFVVIQHLSSNFKSLMPELLAKHTQMEIFTAEDNQMIEPNCIYLNKADRNLIISNGHLHLVERSLKNQLNLPINVLFNSLGVECKEKAIGIVLSGTGSDGTKGIRTIKEAGGTIIVQDPVTAQFDGMLNSAILTNIVDFVLSPKDAGEMLVSISKKKINFKETDEKKGPDEMIVNKILELMYKFSGIDFREYKKPTLLRRIENRMSVCKANSLAEYQHILESDNEEKESLKYNFLIGVTSFFRDLEMFDILKDDIIPAICQNHTSDSPIRIWVPGCSTGQEAVSIAILFDDYIRSNKLPLDFKIFATDVHSPSLAFAGNGIYDITESNEIDEKYIGYFIKTEQKIQIIKRIRDKIVYSNHNLLKDPPFIRVDLISCRNLLIYLENRIQNRIIMNFQFALNTDGFIVLGGSESIGETGSFFKVVNSKWKIYQNKSTVKNIPIQVEPNSRFASSLFNGSPYAMTQHDYKQKESPEGIYYKFLSKKFGLDAMFIDKDFNILFVVGNAGRKLTISEGTFNSNILKSVSPQLAPAIRNGIRRVDSEGKDVVVKGVVNQQGNESYTFDLKFCKIDSMGSSNIVYAIIFGKEVLISDKNALVVDGSRYDETSKMRIDSLEDELKSTRNELQNSIEELETSNEEMQSTNEELMASNEELQSTNEELQSLNEELYTVNSELQEKNRELQILFDDMNNMLNSTDIGTLFLDDKLRIRKFTPAITTHFNLQDNDLGRPISSFSSNFDERIRMSIIEDSERVLKKVESIEKEVQDKSGNYYLEHINPYISSENKIDGVVITLVNTNHIKEVEKNLAISENKFRNIFEHSPVGKYLLYSDGKITVNQAFNDMLGYDNGEIRMLDEVIYPEDAEPSRAKIKEVLNSHNVAIHKRRLVKKSGEVIWTEIRSMAQRNVSDDKPIYILSSVLDITERLKIEEENNKARRDAEIANLHKNYFLANMSHELRTPLNSIIGFSELLNSSNFDPKELHQYINIINESGNNLLNLINDIIDVAKIEADEMKLEKESVNIFKMLKDLKNSYEKNRLLNKEKGLKFDLQLPKNCEEFILQTDGGRLNQVVINLLNNAVKFANPSTPISFGFTIDTDFLEFFVEDEGLSIPPDKLEEIFERFNQLDYTRKSQYGGTGLGLTICRGIINSLGGKIWAESEEGKGATFKFTLPLHEVKQESKPEHIAKEIKDYKGLFAGKKIMVVDDDPSMQIYFRKILEPTQAIAFYPTNGIEAVRLYKEIPGIDLVLMDIQMPEMNGIEAFRMIKKLNPNAKVIAHTAYSLAEERLTCLSEGFVSYLVKPIKHVVLFQEMLKFL